MQPELNGYELANQDARPAVPALASRIPLLVVTAAYPGVVEPDRAGFVRSVLEGISDRFEVTVVAPRVHQGDPREETAGAVAVRRFRYPSGGRILKEIGPRAPAVHLAYLASGLATAMRAGWSIRPAAVYAHWLLPAGPIGWAVARGLGVPLVVNALGSDLHRYAFSGPLRRRLAARVARGAARHVAAAAGIAEGLVRLGASPASIRIIPPAYDPSRFRPVGRAAAREALGIEGRGPYLLFVGDWTVEKGVPTLLRAADAALPAGAELWLLGRGPEERTVREAAQGPLMGRLRILGTRPNAEVALWMSAADALVLPSLGEGMPVCVQEALCCGLPVVASRVGGVPELVRDGENGLLHEPGDEAGLAGAIGRLTGEPGLSARLAEGARATPRLPSASERAREVAEVLLEAIGGMRTTGR